jgi:hypothetical protein
LVPVVEDRVTVSVAEALVEPEAAVIEVEPTAKLVVSPALLMVATVVVLELHCTELVKSCVLPFV